MAGWHHQCNGHEFEQAPGVGDGQGGLACCGPWGHKESDMTERLNLTEPLGEQYVCYRCFNKLCRIIYLSYLFDIFIQSLICYGANPHG